MAGETRKFDHDMNAELTADPEIKPIDLGMPRPWRIALRLMDFQMQMIFDLGGTIVIGRAHPDTRATVGHMRVLPNSRNVIPGTVHFSVDLRAPTAELLAGLEQQFRAAATSECSKRRLDIEMVETVYFPPTPFAPECKNAVRAAAERLGYSNMELVSGAGHDAIYLARVCPAGMIFVPCKDGISHNEIEDAKEEHITAGCNVLLHAMLDRAGVV